MQAMPGVTVSRMESESWPSSRELLSRGVSVRVIVRGVSSEIPLVRVDGEQGRQFLLNKSALGALWGKVKRGDILELSVRPEPGQPTKVLSVRRV